MAKIPTRYLLVGLEVVGVVLAEDKSDPTKRMLVLQPEREPLNPSALEGLSADLWGYTLEPTRRGMTERLLTEPLGTISAARTVGLEDTGFKHLPVFLPQGAEVLSLMFRDSNDGLNQLRTPGLQSGQIAMRHDFDEPLHLSDKK